MLDYRGALSEDDFVELTRVRRRVVREGGTIEDPLFWFGVGIVVLAGWGYSAGPAPNPDAFWWLPFALLCFAVWGRRRVDPRKLWRAESALREEFRGSVAEAALEARLGAVDARIPWTFFSAHLASARGVVLFVGAHLNVMLSRGMFASDEAWQAALAIIATRVPLAMEQHGTSARRIRRTFAWFFGLLILFLAWHFAQIQK